MVDVRKTREGSRNMRTNSNIRYGPVKQVYFQIVGIVRPFLVIFSYPYNVKKFKKP